jgi:Asp-tRNA(Asn)/Glu-tRNA(Gln) amidotransferase A subunit family amidase
MDASQLYWLSAEDAARAIHGGTISSEQLMENCLARVGEVEDQVQAWQFLDPEYALNQARARDEDRSTGQPVGPLHGVPVGIKDIIDTEDMPTEDGIRPARRATPITRSIRRVARRAGLPPRSPLAWCRSRSGARPTAR